jgi:hypothetical protein
VRRTPSLKPGQRLRAKTSSKPSKSPLKRQSQCWRPPGTLKDLQALRTVLSTIRVGLRLELGGTVASRCNSRNSSWECSVSIRPRHSQALMAV